MGLEQLRYQLVECFNLSELHNLCFDLGINFDSLAGQTIEDKSRELVNYCSRRSHLPKLIQQCKRLRPQVNWTNYELSPQQTQGQDPSDLAKKITKLFLATQTDFEKNLDLMVEIPIIQASDVMNFNPDLQILVQMYQQLSGKKAGSYLTEIQEHVSALQIELQLLRAERKTWGIEAPYRIKQRIRNNEIRLRLLELVLDVLSENP